MQIRNVGIFLETHLEDEITGAGAGVDAAVPVVLGLGELVVLHGDDGLGALLDRGLVACQENVIIE